MGDRPRHLLHGYKVLDFIHSVAGLTTTRLMAGMGAKIIKRRQQSPDQSRPYHLQ